MDSSTCSQCEVMWHSRIEGMVASRGMVAALQVIMELPQVFDLAFRVEAGGGAPTTATFLLDGFDAEHTRSVAAQVRRVLHGFAPWMGLDEVAPTQHSDRNSETIYDLVETKGPGRGITHEFAPTWTVAADQETRTTMLMRVHRLNVSGDEPMTMSCEVSIHGEANDAGIVASMLAGELAGSTRYASRLRRGHGAGVQLELPLDVAGWLLSTPSRIRNAWPTHALASGDDVMSKFIGATPPHTAVFGGSGLGKTTFLEHRINAQIADGNPVVVLCPHGDLPIRAASILNDAGADFDAIDFGNTQMPPRWSVLSPPSGVPTAEWLDVVPEIVLARWRAKHDLNGQMAGPMWYFAFLAGATLLALDPDGPWPITKLGELVTEPLDPRWNDVAEHIGDDEAMTRLRQVRDAISNDREKHYAPWLLSKLSSFTSNSKMRRIVEHRESSFDVAKVLAGRSLLIAAPQSSLGDDGASVVLTGVLQQLWNVARRQPVGQRRRILVVIDEAQLIDPAITMTLLAEGRKFGIELVLATQSPQSLDADLRTAVLANSGAIGTFRIGPADAALLDLKFPTVPVGTMQRLAKFTMAVTDGEHDVIGATPPPLANPDDVAPFQRAHRRTLEANTVAPSVATPVPHGSENDSSDAANSTAPADDVDPFIDMLDNWTRK